MKKNVNNLAATTAYACICGLSLLAAGTMAAVARDSKQGDNSQGDDSQGENRGIPAIVQHVLLISVDGLHQSDLAWYIQTHPQSTLAGLASKGVDYSDASTPFPSDSFPGMVGLATGGNARSTGIYYDDTWNHNIFPAGTTNCSGPAPGAEVTYFEALDLNLGALDAG